MNQPVHTYPAFNDIKVSTHTFIVLTNVSIDIQKLFDYLPITNYIVIPKKRGRKKKVITGDPNEGIPDGSIISLDLAGKIRGIRLKIEKKKERNYFRNSVTVVMRIDGKKINFKISRNGKFQMTGCRTQSQGERCIHHMWNYIHLQPDIYKYTDNVGTFNAVFIPAMRNCDFALGFLVDREKMDSYFNENTSSYSLLETSIGYTGVNIKIPIQRSIKDIKLTKITCNNGVWDVDSNIPYQYYLNNMKPKEQQKKLGKDRYTTLLIFHSGKVIISSMCREFAIDAYNFFIDIVSKYRDVFEEKLDL